MNRQNTNNVDPASITGRLDQHISIGRTILNQYSQVTDIHRITRKYTDTEEAECLGSCDPTVPNIPVSMEYTSGNEPPISLDRRCRMLRQIFTNIEVCTKVRRDDIEASIGHEFTFIYTKTIHIACAEVNFLN